MDHILRVFVAAIALTLLSPLLTRADVKRDESDLGTHGFAKSGEVRIHYVTKGSGPLVVMIHGFPCSVKHSSPSCGRKWMTPPVMR